MYKTTEKNYEYIKTITDKLLDITFNNEDWKFAQNECLKYIDSEYYDIVCLAITCLGHIARIHKCIEKEKIINLLNEKQKNEELMGVIEETLDEINWFIK